MTEYKYHLEQLQEIRDNLSPDIDEEGRPDDDLKLAAALDYFIPILEKKNECR